MYNYDWLSYLSYKNVMTIWILERQIKCSIGLDLDWGKQSSRQIVWQHWLYPFHFILQILILICISYRTWNQLNDNEDLFCLNCFVVVIFPEIGDWRKGDRPHSQSWSCTLLYEWNFWSIESLPIFVMQNEVYCTRIKMLSHLYYLSIYINFY
jgi:hypothetical protein